MRVGVVGLGAVGSIFFNRLLHHINPLNVAGSKSAHRVFALVKPQHLPRLESVALYERGQPDPILRVPVRTPPNALALTTGVDKHVTDPLDVVLIAVKSNDTLDVAQQLAVLSFSPVPDNIVTRYVGVPSGWEELTLDFAPERYFTQDE